jgi:4-carboxymuconolactone decarboxylase
VGDLRNARSVLRDLPAAAAARANMGSMPDRSGARGRIQPVDPQRLTPDQQEVADRIAGTRGRLPGPYTALLHVPLLADRVQSLGAYLRWESGLDRGLTELAILVVAHRWSSGYAGDAHEPIALREGLPDDVVRLVRSGGDLAELPDPYRAVATYARELASDGRGSDEAFIEVVAQLGTAATIELTVLVGFYSLISMALNGLGWD